MRICVQVQVYYYYNLENINLTSSRKSEMHFSVTATVCCWWQNIRYTSPIQKNTLYIGCDLKCDSDFFLKHPDYYYYCGTFNVVLDGFLVGA